MNGINQNFSMYAGDTKRVYVDVVDHKGVVVDITGASIAWTLKQGGSEILRKTTPEQITITEPINGKLTILLKPEDTLGLSGDCTHWMRITKSNGEVYTILDGTVTLRKPK